jgi:hypothetical protein
MKDHLSSQANADKNEMPGFAPGIFVWKARQGSDNSGM